MVKKNTNMKIYIFLFLGFFFGSSMAMAQDKNKASLVLKFPSNFRCDSVWLEVKADGLASVTALPYRSNKKVISFKNVLSSTTVDNNNIRIFFKNNNYNLVDTLDFLSTNKDARIEFVDSANHRLYDVSKFELVNVYNFDRLFADLIEVTQESTAEEEPATTIPYVRGGIYNNMNVLNFFAQNLANPFVIDLFTHFVLFNPLYDYAVAKKFFNEKIYKLVHNSARLTSMENMLEAKIIYSEENVSAPNFSFVSLSGDTISSENLRGKYLLINFWATWCGPCIEEFPILKSIINKYSSADLTTISFSQDKNLVAWKTFVEKNDMTWTQASSENNVATLLGVNLIPQVYLLNPSGMIVYNSTLKPNNDTGLVILRNYLRENIENK